MNANLSLTYLKKLEDPISPINKIHELNAILLICVISTLYGAETWKQIEEFGKAKQKLMRKLKRKMINGVFTNQFQKYFK